VAVDDVHPLKVFSQPLSDRSFSGKIVRLCALVKIRQQGKKAVRAFVFHLPAAFGSLKNAPNHLNQIY